MDVKSYTFKPPEGMNYDGVVEYLNSYVGKLWVDDKDQSPGDDRQVYAVLGLAFSDSYIPIENQDRDNIVSVLERDGFARTDNYQDHLEPLDN